MFDVGRDLGLFTWIVAGLCASLATGSIVGVITSAPLRTYKMAMWSFLGAGMTWAITSLLCGLVVQFLLGVLMMNNFGLFGLLAGLFSIALSAMLMRLERSNRSLRWAVLGSLSAWLAVSIGSVVAYQNFTGPVAEAAGNSLPEGFWACIVASMALSTVLGACIGGMIFRQRSLWRS
jgi:hypothetical protein